MIKFEWSPETLNATGWSDDARIAVENAIGRQLEISKRIYLFETIPDLEQISTEFTPSFLDALVASKIDISALRKKMDAAISQNDPKQRVDALNKFFLGKIEIVQKAIEAAGINPDALRKRASRSIPFSSDVMVTNIGLGVISIIPKGGNQ